jgi:flagellin-like hook-associated protein FlgL
MKRFVKWTGLLAGIGVAGAVAFRAVQAGRRQLKDALSRAEAVTDKTRAALDETQAAIHDTRAAL